MRDFIYRGSDSVVRHWTTRGADGWRLDAAQEMDHRWWRDFRGGPVDATPYLLGDQLDGVMNYRFRQDYPQQAAAVSFNLVDSHNTNRALHVLTEPGDSLEVAKERQRLALLPVVTLLTGDTSKVGTDDGVYAFARVAPRPAHVGRSNGRTGKPARPLTVGVARERLRRNSRAADGVEASVVGRPLDDTDLIQRAKRGDTHAYEELMYAYQGIAFRTAYVIAGNAADAEEAAQDGFVKAWRALGRFREGAPFRPWLLRIVANEARNRRRSAGRRAHLVLRAATERPSGDAAPSPEAAFLSAEQREELLVAVNGLPEGQRAVISLRYFVGLSEQEVAEALDLPQGTVKSRTSRALERLRESYD